MTRIAPLTESSASPEGAQLLSAIKSKLGMVPNLYATIAHAPAALSATLAFGDALGKASISAPVREQLALAIAGVNTCDYCASAHTAIGKMNGLDESELNNNLNARASDPKVQALLTLATDIVESRGNLSESQISSARSAGVNDTELVEVVALVAHNIFTNYINHIAQTEIDFPLVSTQAVCN